MRRVIVLLLSLALAASARADEDAYARHMDNGVKLFHDGDPQAALAEFEAAYATSPRASPLVNQALCFKKLRRYADAVDALEKAVARHADTLEERHRAAAEKEIADLRALIAWVVVATDPKDARLFVDNPEGSYEPRRDPDGGVPLAPGPNKLRAEADGYAPALQIVTVVAGRANAAVTLTLAPKDGEVEVHALPGAWIAVDGRERERGQFRGRLEPGVHAVVVHDEARASALQIVVAAGRRALVVQQPDGTLVSDAKAPEPAAAPSLRGFYLLGGAGVLTLANNIDAFSRNSAAQAGYALGGAVGYRVARWAAFEAFGQFSDVRIHGAFAVPGGGPNPEFLVRSGRAGLGLRVLVPSATPVRFAALVGGGVLYEQLALRGAPDDPRYGDQSGVDAFGEVDLMLEAELSHVLIDLGAQNTLESSKHFSHDDGYNPFAEQPLLFVGPKLQIGYAFW